MTYITKLDFHIIDKDIITLLTENYARCTISVYTNLFDRTFSFVRVLIFGRCSISGIASFFSIVLWRWLIIICYENILTVTTSIKINNYRSIVQEIVLVVCMTGKVCYYAIRSVTTVRRFLVTWSEKTISPNFHILNCFLIFNFEALMIIIWSAP